VRVLLKRFGSRSAIAVMTLASVLALAGCGSTNSSFSGNNVTATPSFSPGAGTYKTSQPVTIADTTQGAVLYCTTDGTTPTSSSPQCSQPTMVYQTEFLQAIAVAPGKSSSAVASAGYTINYKAAPTPVFSPAGGTYPSGQQVTITDTLSGANIYYTTDGSVPSANSTLYTGPIALTSNITLSAIVVATGYDDSGVASAAYIVNTNPATPVISPAGGTFSAAQTVTITDATQGATIYYTLDGSTPTASSTPYSAPFTVSSTETVSAIAISTGGSSTIATAAFTLNLPVAAAPTFNPAAGTYTAAQQVALSSVTPGASIYYTTDGSTPTATPSELYSSPISVTTSETINAIATAAGVVQSAMSSAAYTIHINVPAPTISPATGATLPINGTVTLSNTDANAVMYYTTDGSKPSASSSKYTAPISVTTVGSVTINAIAVDTGASSTVATASYTVAADGTPINGTVMSGTQAVKTATIQLYSAGIVQTPTPSQPGYGTSGTALGSPVTTDSNGKFSITAYICSASPNDLLYVVASGGDSGNGTNASLQLMAVLGPCGSLSTSSVMVNEVTTVASVYSLAQFMTTAPNVGAPASNYRGLSNAFATVGNLVNATTGQAPDHTPAYTTSFALDTNIVNNSTVPQARINTLANALNACTSNSGGCSGLFTAATPNSGTAPATTLQAILNIAQNPGNNAAKLYAAASGSSAFSPALLAAPNDWTLALTFTGGGLGVASNIVATDANGDVGVGPNLATSLAIDANGNVFVSGFGEFGYPTLANYNYTLPILAEFNNLGAPQTMPTKVSSDATPVITFGGNNLGYTQANWGFGLGPMVIDTAGNVWAGVIGNGGALYTLDPNLNVLASATQNDSVNAVTIDNQNNAWVTVGAGAIGTFPDEFTYFAGNSTLQSVSLAYANAQYQPVSPVGMIFDSQNNLWADDISSRDATLYLYAPDGSPIYSAYPTRGQGSSEVMSMAPDNAGNIYVCGDGGGTTLDVFNATSAMSGLAPTTYMLGSRGCGEQLLLDGQGHLFAISNGFTRDFQDFGTIDEYTTTGVAISPNSGYTGTSSAEQPTITQDPNVAIDALDFGTIMAATAGAIDGSGNLWVINPDTNNGTGMGNSTTGNVLVEFVGLAAPVVTPVSAAMANGQYGVRP
jgi:Chitobiase/beta-hexosaminidase C-terminal domain